MENPQKTEQVTEKQTLREELVTALKDAEIKNNQPKETENAIEEGNIEKDSEPEHTDGDNGGETKETSDSDSIQPDAEVKEEKEEVKENAEETAEKEFPLIPNNWSQEEKDSFQKLIDSGDPEKRLAAEIMLERYNSFKKTFFDKTQQYAKDTKEYKEINRVFEPVQKLMDDNRIDKASYIKNMMAWEYKLSTDPVNTVKAIMQKFNVRPEQIAPIGGDDFNLDENDLTKNKTNVNNEYVSKRELEELRTAIANQPLLAQIAQFAQATDSTGKLLHPRFEEVKTIMGQIIQSKKAGTLAEAYSKAVKVIDDDSDAQSEPAIDLDKIRQKVKQSKKASKGIKTGSGKPDLARMSIKEELMVRLNH